MFRMEMLGGVGEYGRNCFYIENFGSAILLDCGIMNNPERTLPDLTRSHLKKLDAVFISHSHPDHAGALYLLEEGACAAPVIMSEETACQLGRLPERAETFSLETRGQWLAVSHNIRFRWGFSGHMLGSVSYEIELNGERIFYSGDFVADSYVHRADFPSFGDAGYKLAIMDAGHIEKEMSNQETLAQLRWYLAANEKGPFIIPSASSGKTADLALNLFRHVEREIFVGSGLHAFFRGYEKGGAYLREGYEEAFHSFNEACLKEGGMPGADAVCFVPEEREAIAAICDAHPDAALIVTGYSKPPLYERFKNEGRCAAFFYKTHPDKKDLRQLADRIKAEEIVLFHSPCEEEMQLFESEVSANHTLGMQNNIAVHCIGRLSDRTV